MYIQDSFNGCQTIHWDLEWYSFHSTFILALSALHLMKDYQVAVYIGSMKGRCQHKGEKWLHTTGWEATFWLCLCLVRLYRRTSAVVPSSPRLSHNKYTVKQKIGTSCFEWGERFTLVLLYHICIQRMNIRT